MQLITKDELLDKKEEFIERIRNGAIFVYPTDTIYGIGCNALLDEPVKKIREWKNRTNPFSVIAPDKKWIEKNCEMPTKGEWLKKLPGSYTLVYPMKKQVVSKYASEKTLGIRIPEHWISELIRDVGVPVITTSVNVKGEVPLFSLENIPSRLKAFLNFAIDAGKLKAKASKVIDCTTGKTLRE